MYEFSADKSTLKAAGQFLTEAMTIALYEQNIYTIEQGKVQVRTFQVSCLPILVKKKLFILFPLSYVVTFIV